MSVTETIYGIQIASKAVRGRPMEAVEEGKHLEGICIDEPAIQDLSRARRTADKTTCIVTP